MLGIQQYYFVFVLSLRLFDLHKLLWGGKLDLDFKVLYKIFQDAEFGPKLI